MKRSEKQKVQKYSLGSVLDGYFPVFFQVSCLSRLPDEG